MPILKLIIISIDHTKYLPLACGDLPGHCETDRSPSALIKSNPQFDQLQDDLGTKFDPAVKP